MVGTDEPLRGAIERWLALDPEPADRAELQALVQAAEGSGADADSAAVELADRFAGRLTFGTSGLRAPMGAGPRRMNRLVVRQAAAGLVRFLTAEHPDRPVTVVIGFDARHRSRDFAEDTARVVAAAGGRALVLPGPNPTPVLAFAVRHLGADAGVMCTASHNPPDDNGYKVYLGDGAQIVPPVDARIAAAIDEVVAMGVAVPVAPADDAAVARLDDSVVAAYTAHVTGLPVVDDRGEGRDLTVVHTSLHGCAGRLVGDVLAAKGFAAVVPVAAQAQPDPDFPTTPFPNPEEAGALDLALAEARRRGADLVLASDPDGDRLGVAVPAADGDGDDGWRVLTGNEIGALLCDHLLARTAGADRLVVSTIVSSRLIAALAAEHGVHHVETLTGFKWIVRPAIDRPDLRWVFGFEEALGYSVEPYVRDKDGIAAALVVADLVADARAAGTTVLDRLETLARRHGHHAGRTRFVRLDGPGATERLQAAMGRWRAAPPAALGGATVTAVHDLAGGGDLPPTDAVVVDVDGGGRLVVRPSGTEPKLKLYAEVVVPVGAGAGGFAEARRAGEQAVDALLADAEAHLAAEG